MDGLVKFLLVLHAAAAIVLVGSATHNGVLAVAHLRGRPLRPKLRRLHATVLMWSYAATFVLGLVIYPAFRVGVREGFLDRELPVATGLFEVKEHWLALGLLMVIAHLALARSVQVHRHSVDATFYHWLGVAVMVVVWFSTFTGLGLVALRPVGG